MLVMDRIRVVLCFDKQAEAEDRAFDLASIVTKFYPGLNIDSSLKLIDTCLRAGYLLQ